MNHANMISLHLTLVSFWAQIYIVNSFRSYFTLVMDFTDFELSTSLGKFFDSTFDIKNDIWCNGMTKCFENSEHKDLQWINIKDAQNFYLNNCCRIIWNDRRWLLGFWMPKFPLQLPKWGTRYNKLTECSEWSMKANADSSPSNKTETYFSWSPSENEMR